MLVGVGTEWPKYNYLAGNIATSKKASLQPRHKLKKKRQSHNFSKYPEKGGSMPLKKAN